MSQVKKDGFSQFKSYCVHCRSLCAVVVTVENGRLTKVSPDNAHPNGRCICPKGRAVPELVYSPQRLRSPLRRTNPKDSSDPGWKQVSWKEALEFASGRIAEIREKCGDEAVVLSRGTPGGSPARDYRPWVHRLANVLNTPNVVTTGHICNWHREQGSKLTFGTGFPQPDLQNANCIVIWGFNPARTWATFDRALRQAVRRGAKLIVVDPFKNEVARRADCWVPLRPGSDGALALSLIYIFIHERLFDRNFVLNWTNAPFLVWEDTGDLVKGADLNCSAVGTGVIWDTVSNKPLSLSEQNPGAFLPALDGTWEISVNNERRRCSTVWHLLKKLVSGYAPEAVEDISRVSAEKIRRMAYLMAENHPVSFYTYNGLEQHAGATNTNRAICILYALSGDFDKIGGNVILPEIPINSLEGKEYLSSSQAQKRLGLQERPLGPPVGKNVTAYDFYHAILKSEPYLVRGLLSFGGNILLANGETLTGVKALQRLDFYLQTELFMTPSALFADIVLPAATVWEGWGVRTSFIRSPASVSNRVQLRPQVIEPLYESRPDEKIICELAEVLGIGEYFWNGDLEKAYNYMLEPTGLTVSALRENPGGVTISQVQAYQKFRQGGFKTPSGRVEIFSTQLREHNYPALPVYNDPLAYFSQEIRQEYPLILTNAKSRFYCHSQQRAIPSLRQRLPEPFLQVHPLTAKKADIENHEWIYLETTEGKIQVKAQLTPDIPEGVVCMQHGWWQSCTELSLEGYDPFSENGSNINLVISNSCRDPVSGSVPHKCYPCRLRKKISLEKG